MEKILSKSKSRYFFGGKKKSAKDQGISSSDLHAIPPEGSDPFSAFPNRGSPPQATPRILHVGLSQPNVGGPWTHYSRDSPVINNPPEHPPLKKHIFPSASAALANRSSENTPPSQSRYEVHISPTAFSPIMMPSSTSPQDPYKPSVSATSSQHRQASPPKSKPAGEYNRLADKHAHSRSQSALTPDQALSAQGRLRRHGIPESFMDMTGISPTERHRWNGQSLSTEYNMSDALKHVPTISNSSDTLVVHPSASAPASSNLSSSQILPGLAHLRDSSTVPTMSAYSPLPRSNPSYNLAALTPASAAPPPNRPTEIDLRSSSTRPQRGQPTYDFDRPRRDPPPVPRSTPPPTIPDIYPSPHASSSHYHTPSASFSSEKGIGYKGLAFPLPPSSEQGLAMPYSSSQSSLFSATSGPRSGDMPTTPKRTRDGKEERDAKTPKSTGSRGTAADSGRSSREKSGNANDGRTSPTPNMGTVRRRREQNPLYVSGTDIEGKREASRKVQQHGQKRSDNASGVGFGGSGPENTMLAAGHALAASEDTPDPSPRPLPQPPRVSEPTKPLALTPGRKSLHTMRSFSTFTEKKLLHASASHHDLSSSFDGENPRSQNKPVNSIPVRVTAQREAHGSTSQHDSQGQIPARSVLPTPPHSSYALSHLAEEQKKSSVEATKKLTLDDVADALQAQRGRFEELAEYMLDVARRHLAERDSYAGRVGNLEGAVEKMEREIRGLRWLVLEHARARQSVAENPAVAATETKIPGDDAERKLRRSLTMPQLATLAPYQHTHARRKRDAIGLGLGFSPESQLSSSATTSPPEQEKDRFRKSLLEVGDKTPSMDEIIDKLMGVRQWASADVRVSIVDAGGADGSGGGDTKRIVFRER